MHLKKFAQICWPLSLNKVQAILFGILASGFFFLDTGDHRNIFYGFLLISAFSFKLPNTHDFLLKLVVVFLAINLISVTWSTNGDPEEYWRAIKVAPLIFMALLACQTIKIEKYLACYVYSAAITALILIISNYSEIWGQYVLGTEGVWRLTAYGRGANENIAGVLYAVAALILLHLKLPLRGLCLCLVMSVLFLTLSRGAILAFVLSVGAVALISHKRILFAFIPLITLPIFLPNIFSYMINRGTTGRSEIWSQALDYFMQSPIIGHGAANALQYEVTDQGRVYNHAHNIYLATLNDTGLVGLIALLSIITLMLVRSYMTNNLALLSIILFIVFLIWFFKFPTFSVPSWSKQHKLTSPFHSTPKSVKG